MGIAKLGHHEGESGAAPDEEERPMDDHPYKRERLQNQRIEDLEVRVTRLEKMVTQLTMLRAGDEGKL